MQLERVLKKEKMTYETMPAPRKLSTDCGVSIVFESDDVKTFIEKIDKKNIHRIYHMYDEIYEMVYENY
jgi:hypothetical protein